MREKGLKKKLLSVILIFCLLICSACGEKPAPAQERQVYEDSVAALLQMEPDENGLYEVTEELVAALQNAEYTEPKNIIFMIGDGMGFPIMEAAQTVYGDALYKGTLAMNYLPLQSTQCTYSATDQTTDSAAGATALATGYKTMNRTVAMSVDTTETYKTTLELAAEKGKSTGIVVTKAVTDATPAAFTSHVISRSLQEEIAAMQLEKMADGTLDLVLGGGKQYYEAKANAEALAAARESGVTYTNRWDEASGAQLPVLGLFAEDMMDTTDDKIPAVAELTACALESLSQDENGFFLMVEGSQIDSYGEKNEFERQVKELYDFDCAVAVAMRYVALHPDTVLIVTADHETGGVTIPAEPTLDNIDETFYTTGKHTCKTVPVLAAGYGTETLLDVNENTDLAIFVASLLGEEAFGQKSAMHTLWSTKKKTDIGRFVLSEGMLADVRKGIQNARALHMTVANPTDERLPLPELKLVFSGKEYTVEPQKDYIEAGESLVLSYVFPVKCWKEYAFEKVSELDFTGDGAETALEISSLRITERELTR